MPASQATSQNTIKSAQHPPLDQTVFKYYETFNPAYFRANLRESCPKIETHFVLGFSKAFVLGFSIAFVLGFSIP